MKKLQFLIICIGIFFLSCNDKDERLYLEPEDQTTAKDFFEEQQYNTKQTFKLNTSDLPKDINLKGGINITIPKDALTKNGKQIEGAITVEIREMMTPSAIILSGTNTNYAGTLFGQKSYFISDGFFHIDIKQNGESIDQHLANGKFLSITIPFADENRWNTQIWEGSETIDKNQFGWIDPNLDDIGDNENTDRQENWIWKGNDGFQFGFGKLGWCNCDIFWGDAEKTTMKVTLTGNVGELASFMGGSGDTFIYFLGKGYRTVAQLYTKVGDNTVASYDNSMPVGATGKIFAFSIKEGAFSFASKDIIIEKNMHITLDLKEVTKDNLLKTIKDMDSYK